MEKTPFDAAKSEAFAEKLISIYNSGALAVMTSIGHRTGLFDVMSKLPPSTSEQIAVASKLNERYVREWLGALVIGRIIEYDPEGALYSLPPEHASWMTRDAAPNNMSVFAQYISMIGTVEDQIIECFKRGGGVPYSEFKRFHHIMAEDSGQTIVAPLFDHILPLVSGLTKRLQRGIDVLDVGCGSGRAINLMARTFPNSRFTGYDFSEEAVNTARAEAAQYRLTNIRFEVKDAAKMDIKEMYDFITTFDAIHDQVNPEKVLVGIAHALKHNGIYLMQDIAASSHLQNNMDHPIGPFMYAVSCMHCMTVSLALNGKGLGAMWGEERATEMLHQAGFTKVEVKKLPHDIFNNYYIMTK